MSESTEVKTFTIKREDGKATDIVITGGDDALMWAITDKVKTAPVMLDRGKDRLNVRTRDEDVVAEIKALLEAHGYRG